ncbi:MAG: hypothetical protein AAF549_02795 [Pseudomonadota bacterium]
MNDDESDKVKPSNPSESDPTKTSQEAPEQTENEEGDSEDNNEPEVVLSRFELLKEKVQSTEFLVKATGVFVLLFFVFIVYQACTPRKGNILYGMCYSFLEIQLPFPETISISELELYRRGVRMYFTHWDAFGQERLELVECTFKQDPNEGVQLEDVFFNYIKETTLQERAPGKGRFYQVKREHIDLFNRSRSPAAILEDIDLSIEEDTIIRAF